MKIKSIKKFFIFFSLLIILVGIVSATEIEEDSDVKNSTENVEESMFSDTTILQSNSIVEKKDKNIFKSDKPTKTSTIPTKISIDSINNTQYTDNVTISGNYKDVTGRILRYTPLSLKINSNTYQIQTDNNGNFIEKFRTNAVGTNIVTISYSGNTKFSGTTTTETFLVTKQKTNITINPIETTQYTDYVVISGKYTDKNGVNLRYTPITLNINGIKYTTTTNNYGDYTFNYKTNNVGSNVVTSSYPGNTRYSGTTFTTTFYVTNKDTKITINPIETKSIVSILRITGKYEDNSGNKLRYTTLTLNINGIKYTTKTDANGEFTLNYQTRTVGENKIIVSYPGNIRYKAATTESTFNVISKATLLKLNVYNDFVQYTDYNEIWGIFTDNDGNPLRYTTLNLNINGKKYYIKTDNDGQYSYNYRTNTIGVNNITVSYSGNNRYNAQNISSTFTVIPKDTILKFNPGYESYSSDRDSYIIKLDGNFTDYNGNPLRYTTLEIDVDGNKYKTQTDFYGKFNHSFISNLKNENVITVSYSGNARYIGTSVKKSYSKINTEIFVDDNIFARVGDNVSITGRVNDEFENRLTNIPITIIVNGENYNTNIDDKGYFKLDYLINKMGVNNVTLKYNGNYIYAPSTKSIRIIADRIETHITISNTVKEVNTPFITIKGQFYDYKGNMLRYTPLTLMIDGKKYTTKTDKNGLFTCYYDGNPNITHTLTAIYAGNTKYDKTQTQICFIAKTKENIVEILTPHFKEHYEDDEFTLYKEHYEDLDISDTVNLGSDNIYGFSKYLEGLRLTPGVYIVQNRILLRDTPANTITEVIFYFKNDKGDIIKRMGYQYLYMENIFKSDFIDGYIPFKAIISFQQKTPTEIYEFNN